MPTARLNKLILRDDGAYELLYADMAIVNPAMTDGFCQACSPAEYGFSVWPTGGNCTAWGQECILPSGEHVNMLVTQEASHEIDPTQPIQVGVYDDSECWLQWDVSPDGDVSNIINDGWKHQLEAA